jgi:hypothetical protein
MRKGYKPDFGNRLGNIKRIFLLFAALLITTVPLTILNTTVSAAQITQRSLLIANSQASATTNYTFTFTPSQTSQIQSIVIQSCSTPLGACSAPGGLNLAGGTVTTGSFQGATSFTKDTTSGGCTTAGVLCLTRSDTTSQTLTARTITDTGAVNQNTTNCTGAPNCTFFERITTYSDTAYTTGVDSGTVASSTTQAFTVNAVIQEVLAFCVGNTTIDNLTTQTTSSKDCTTISGTSLNLGVLSSTQINVSPVPSATYNGDAENGQAILNTNASNGTTVAYNAIPQSGTNHQGTLRVAGSTCLAGTGNTDQCIDAAGVSSLQLNPGVEHFGMTVAGVNCGNVTAYSCTFGTSNNLTRASNYNCNGSTSTYAPDSGVLSSASGCNYAWDETGTSQTIATATIPVGNEALILKFAATPNLITPTGSYTAQADFIATPVY